MQRLLRRLGWIAFALIGVTILASLPSIWGDLVYPLRYQEEILRSSTEFNLPPSLVAGVIFTESHFNPQATSRVGARGLMQLMPATAAGIAQRLEDPNFTPDKLYDPATNIRYGSYYLRNLLDRYNGDIDVALAGYNGGPGVAGRYAISRDAPIPLETSGFIVKVKRARDTYSKIYGQDLASNIGEKLRQEEPKTLFDKVFGWIFT